MIEVIEMVRNRPAFYLSNKKSITLLYVFTRGFEMGANSEGSKGMAHMSDFCEFNVWLARELGFGGTARSWCEMVIQRTSSEEQAFDYLFELLDKYKREKPNSNNQQ